MHLEAMLVLQLILQMINQRSGDGPGASVSSIAMCVAALERQPVATAAVWP